MFSSFQVRIQAVTVSLRQCSYWAQFELVVDWGLQARGREGEHRRLKVFGVEGEIIGKEGGRFRDAGCGWLRCAGVSWGCGEDLWLKLEKLTHETKVGWDDCPALLDDVKGFVQPQLLCPHDIGHADGRWAWDACFAVDQDLSPRVLHKVWKRRITQANINNQFYFRSIWQIFLLIIILK